MDTRPGRDVLGATPRGTERASKALQFNESRGFKLSMSDSRVTIDSPVGPLAIESNGHAIVGIYFHSKDADRATPAGVIAEAARQLGEYFGGTRRTFSLRLAPTGTSFQRAVWSALAEIPYGETWSYLQLAQRIGLPAAARAVGAANGQNPIPIVVPCHRVIGSDGRLVGFGGGLAVKQFLLRLEQGVLF
jgi:methylated-DNA-[protein]-cysteine S-methyltransferase